MIEEPRFKSRKDHRQSVRFTADGRAVLERELASIARVADRMFEAAAPDQISYLDRLAATDPARDHKRAMLDAFVLRPRQTILELGCGPDTDLASLAEAVTPSSAVPFSPP